MKSTDVEFLATGRCSAQCIRLSPDAWERPTSYGLHDSTKPNACRLPGKLATMSAQMLLELGAFQAITNSSRRVGSCSFSASSRLASRTI